MEGRVDDAVDPEVLGVEFLRQPGLEEDSGWIDSGTETFHGGRKSRMEKRGWGEEIGSDENGTDFYPWGFCLELPKGVPQTRIIYVVVPFPCADQQSENGDELVLRHLLGERCRKMGRVDEGRKQAGGS